MDSNLIWGVILIVYIVPYIFWAVSREQTLEIRKKLRPGRMEEERFDERSTRYGLLWSIGIVLLVLAWWINIKPIGALFLLAILAVIVSGGIWLLKQKALLASRQFRF